MTLYSFICFTMFLIVVSIGSGIIISKLSFAIYIINYVRNQVRCTVHLTLITNINLFLSVYTQIGRKSQYGSLIPACQVIFILNGSSTETEMRQSGRLPWAVGEQCRAKCRKAFTSNRYRTFLSGKNISGSVTCI